MAKNPTSLQINLDNSKNILTFVIQREFLLNSHTALTVVKTLRDFL